METDFQSENLKIVDVDLTNINISDARASKDKNFGRPDLPDDAAPTAIDISMKTRDEVHNQFKEGLGFDPSDLDALSQSTAQMEEVPEHKIQELIQLQKDMTAMLIERFAQNMEAFKEIMPDIYKQFKDYKPSESIEFMCTSNGIPNLYFPDRNEFFYKCFDPVELCNKQVDLTLETSPYRQLRYGNATDELGQIHYRYLNALVNFNYHTAPIIVNPLLTNSAPICLMVGCGLGYHIGHLYERIDIANMVLIEPNSDLFFASLHTFDWANLLHFLKDNNRCIYLMIGHDEDHVFDDLNEFYSRHGRMLAGFMWSMVHYRSPAINKIADRIINDYERSYATMGFFDDAAFALSHGMQHLKNKDHFVRKDVELPEKWKEAPIFVVGNGPSLSHDLPFLRKYQDKAIILACGTALETLYNAGIEPTFYAATERLRVVSEHLSLIPDRDFVRRCILVAGDVIHPETVKHFDNTAIFGKPDEGFYWLVTYKKYELFKNLGYISLMNPLVGNLGVSTAAMLGFKKIYLFGLDNGTKREDGLKHPTENIFYKKIMSKKYENANVSAKNDDYMDEGNFGGKVQSEFLYRLSATYMGVVMRYYDKECGQKFYNCSDGIKIESTEPLHSEDMDFFADLPDLDKEEFRNFIINEKTVAFDITPEEVDKLVDPRTFNYIVDTVIRMLTRERRPESRIDYIFLMQSVCEMLTQVQKSSDYYIADCLAGTLYSAFASIMSNLYSISDEKRAIEICDVAMRFVIYFLEDTKYCFKFVPDFCAEDHHIHIHGKIGQDHGICKAIDLKVRKPYVTAEDRKNYPIKKFIKRYE